MAFLFREVSYKDMSAEEESNRVAAVALSCMFLLVLVVYFFNVIGVFYIEDELFEIAAITGEICLLLPICLCYTTEAASKEWFKYFIVGCTFINSLLIASLLAFHGILIVFLPIFVSIIYYDKKVHMAGLAASLLTTVLSPILSVLFDTLSMDFWHTLLNIYDKGIISVWAIRMEDNPTISNLSGFLGTFVGFPMGFELIGYGAMAYLILTYRRTIRNKQRAEIESIQSHVLLSLSDIIENRDMDTGGHVRRAMDLVRILVDHIGPIPQDDIPGYREYLVKAAVTHDLGKIAVDDELLRKTNRVTEEEYEEIKIHPIKSVEIINAVLGPIEDPNFLEIAKNLAKYHHEHYDGTGYPEGLAGDNIPFEARVMAIADVFDALITERCYHDTMSYDKAYGVVKEGMGTQFDPGLMDVFDQSFDELVEYYEKIKTEDRDI